MSVKQRVIENVQKSPNFHISPSQLKGLSNKNNEKLDKGNNGCCVFCEKSKVQLPFSQMVGRALYSKYSASQNYYYSKDINEILGNQRTSPVIKLKDLVTFSEDEEYLNRFYASKEYESKITRLSEYYKFHRDIARLFMLPITSTLNRYHDKKRRLYYTQITRMLKEKETKKVQEQGKDIPTIKNTPKLEEDRSNSPNKIRNVQGKISEDSKKTQETLKTNDRILALLDLAEEEQEGQQRSQQNNTIQALNTKLQDILSNSTQNPQSYFDASHSIGNLSNFLTHMKSIQSPSFSLNSLSNNNLSNNQPLSKEIQPKKNNVPEIALRLAEIQLKQPLLNLKKPAIHKQIQIPKQLPVQQIPHIQLSQIQVQPQLISSQQQNKLIQSSAQPSQQKNIQNIAQFMKKEAVIKKQIDGSHQQVKMKHQVIQMKSEGMSPVSPFTKIICEKEPLFSNVRGFTRVLNAKDIEAGHMKGTDIAINQDSMRKSLKDIHPQTLQQQFEIIKQNQLQELEENAIINHDKNNSIKQKAEFLPGNSNLHQKKVTNLCESKSKESELNSHNKQVNGNPIQATEQIAANQKINTLFVHSEIKNQVQSNLMNRPIEQNKLFLQQLQPKEQKYISMNDSQKNEKQIPHSFRGGNEQKIVSPDSQFTKQVFSQDKQNHFQLQNQIRSNDYIKENPTNINLIQDQKINIFQDLNQRRNNYIDLQVVQQRNNQNQNKLAEETSIDGINSHKGNSQLKHEIHQPPLNSNNIISSLINLSDQDQYQHKKIDSKMTKVSKYEHIVGNQNFKKISEGWNTDRFQHKDNDELKEIYSDNKLNIYEEQPTKENDKILAMQSSINSGIQLLNIHKIGVPLVKQERIHSELDHREFTRHQNKIKSFVPISQAFNRQSSLQRNSLANQPSSSQISLNTVQVTEHIPSQFKNIENNQVSSNQQQHLITYRKQLSNQKLDNITELKHIYQEVQQKAVSIIQKGEDLQKQITNSNQELLESQNSKQILLRKQAQIQNADISRKGSVTQRHQYPQENQADELLSSRMLKIIKTDIESGAQMRNQQKSVCNTDREGLSKKISLQIKNASTLNMSTQQMAKQSGYTPLQTIPIQTESVNYREQGLSAVQKKMLYKQQVSKNSSDSNLRTTHSNIETNKASQVNVSSQGNHTNNPSAVGSLQSAYTSFINSFGSQQTVPVPSSNLLQSQFISHQNSSKKIIEKIKHTRINSMNVPSVTLIQQSKVIPQPPILGKQLSSEQAKTYQQPQQQQTQMMQPQQQHNLLNGQNNMNKKKIYHKYNKSETDSLPQYGTQNSQTFSTNLGVNLGGGLGNAALIQSNKSQLVKQMAHLQASQTQHHLQTLHSFPQQQPQHSQFEQQQQGSIQGQECKKGVPISSQSSMSPQRRGCTDKKSSDQQQFFTYANNNIVNIYVNSQENGNLVQQNNNINTQNQNIHQNITSLFSSQVQKKNINPNSNNNHTIKKTPSQYYEQNSNTKF